LIIGHQSFNTESLNYQSNVKVNKKCAFRVVKSMTDLTYVLLWEFLLKKSGLKGAFSMRAPWILSLV